MCAEPEDAKEQKGLMALLQPVGTCARPDETVKNGTGSASLSGSSVHVLDDPVVRWEIAPCRVILYLRDHRDHDAAVAVPEALQAGRFCLARPGRS